MVVIPSKLSGMFSRVVVRRLDESKAGEIKRC